MPQSPLDEGDLGEISHCLDRGDLDQAQALIALAGENPAYELATSYLVTRLLYLKGRLDPDRVRQRLSDLLVRVSPFPEAEALLASLGPGSAPKAIPLEPGTDSSLPDPGLANAPTQAGLPAAETADEPFARKPVVPPDSPRPMEIPTAPRLPRGKPAAPPPRVTRQLTDPRQRRSSLPGSPRETVLSLEPESLPTDGDAATAWRAHSLGLAPALTTSTPPRGSDRTRNKRRSGGYSFISAEPAARSSKPSAAALLAESMSARPLSALDGTASEFEIEAAPIVDAHDPAEVTSLAAAAADLLSRHPATTWFAPFDRSLYSLARCSLALNSLTGSRRCELGPATSTLLAAYVGETVRHCHRATWSPGEPLSQRSIAIGAFTCNPYELVTTCASAGVPPTLFDRLAPGLAPEGGMAWLVHTQVSSLAALWPRPPTHDQFPAVAELIAQSPWARLANQPLDGSLGSLSALEQLVEPLGRSASPLRGNEPWLERLCIVLGAYVGEALRRERGGEWRAANLEPGAIQTLEHYVLRLPSGFDAEPAAAFRERIRAQNGVRLVAYAQALSRK